MLIIIILLFITTIYLLINILLRNNSKEYFLSKQALNKVLLKNTHENLFLIDRSYRVVYTNDNNKNSLIKIFTAYYNRHVNDTENTELYEYIKDIFLQKTSVNDILLQIVDDDGSSVVKKYNLLFSCSYLKLSGKDYVILIIHEFTKNTSLRRTLKETVEKFSCLFNNVTIGCAICNTDGKVLEVNDTYIKYLGAVKKESIIDKLNLYNNPCINEEYKNMIRNGIPVFGEVKYDYELINQEYIPSVNKNNNYYRFIANYMYDEENKIQNILIIWVENTLVHIMLRENNMFKDMINSASSISKIGFCSITINKRIQLITKEYLTNLGIMELKSFYTIDDLLKNIHPSDKQEISDFFDKASKTKVSSIKTNIRIKKGNDYRWVEQFFIQQKYDLENNIITITGVNVDIDAQKIIESELIREKERAEMSDKLKSSFLANVSHEIRTPLNAIVGFSDLLTHNDLSEDDIVTYKNIIEENSQILLQLISDILDLSKLEAGTVEFNLSEVDLNLFLEDMKKVYELKNKDNVNVEIKYIPNSVNAVITTDMQKLTQLLTNLVTNAMKFTEKGSIKFWFELRKRDICFYVEDTGCGIPKDKIDDIFQRFIQLNSFKQGTGLGLSICKTIVKSMNGKIGVDSEEGKGSKFWFSLPLINK